MGAICAKIQQMYTELGQRHGLGGFVFRSIVLSSCSVEDYPMRK